MKKITYLMFFACCLTLTLWSTDLGKRRDGTEPGHTGSPGDSSKTCTVCHGGNVINEDGWITSNIPANGYVPGQAYLVTAKNVNIGYNRFGFQVSPQAYDGTLLGKMEEYELDSFRTKLVGNDKYVTYSMNGVDGMDSSTWTFRWIAPDSNINTVTFWGAFNSNLDGHKFSDHTTTSQLVVYKQGFTGLAEKNPLAFPAYPNPFQNKVILPLHGINANRVQVNLFNLEGRLLPVELERNGSELIIMTPDLKEGCYILELTSGNQKQIQKLLHLK